MALPPGLTSNPQIDAVVDAVSSRFRKDKGVARMQGLEQSTYQDTQNRQPYALDPKDAALVQSAQANPALGQLGTPGSFMGQLGQTGTQFGKDNAMLRQAALGQGPSAAQALLRSGLDANSRAARSIAAGARGGNLAGGLRAAIGAGTAANQQAIQQAAAMRAQEQLGAMGQLAGANAALMSGQIGAQNAETGRQAAFGQTYNQGQANAIGARGVQAGIARDAAADLEAQKRRALDAYNSQYALRNQQKQIGMQDDFNPMQMVGALGNIAGTALGAAIPGMGAARAAGAVTKGPHAVAPPPGTLPDFGGRA